MTRRPRESTLFPSPPLFRSEVFADADLRRAPGPAAPGVRHHGRRAVHDAPARRARPRTPVHLLVVGEERLVEETHGRERSEEHTSELQSRLHLVCRLLLEKK